jgi:Galactose oxidase, central domain
MIVSFGMGQRMLNDVWAFNFDENEWEQLRTIGVQPLARQYHIAVMVGFRMVGCEHQFKKALESEDCASV